MKSTHSLKTIGFVLLCAIAAAVAPTTTFAQEQGTVGSNTVSAWVDRLLGGPIDPSALSDAGNAPTQGTVTNIITQILGGGSTNTNPAEGGTGYVNVGGAFNLNTIGTTISNAFTNPPGTAGDIIQGGLGLVGNIIDGAIAFVENPFSSTVNTAIDTYVAIGNQTGIWGNTSVGGTIFGDPGQAIEGAGQSVVNTIVDGIVAITNEILNANSSEGTSPESSQTTGSSESTTESTQNSGGTPASAQGGGNSGHTPSGLGGLGSPSNPLSTGESDTTGANSDHIGTNNVETQTNPYLFEYDPSSTNNNPSGDGAMER